jgi:peptidyl-prolyl cis-trans isomerase SurA
MAAPIAEKPMLIRLIILALMLGLPLKALAQETLDRVMVVVGKELILESEVGQEVQRYFMERGENPAGWDEERLVDLKLEIVQAMIDSKVLYAAAQRDTNIVIQDRDIDDAVQGRLDEILRRVGTERKLEEAMGLPIKAIRRNLKQGMREKMFVEQAQQRHLMGISVSRQEVEQFFETWHDSIPDIGESVRLSHIFLEYKPSKKSEDRAKALADSVRSEILAGRLAFADAAMTFSQDPASGSTGGSIGRTKRGNLVRSYEEVAYRMEPGELSEPVRSEYGWHLIRLDDRQGEYIETSHVLFLMEPTSEDRQSVYDTADSLYSQLKAGTDFAALARKRSDHKLTREAGGDLGWLELSQLEPLVRSRVRDLKLGEYCRPFRSKVEGKDGMQIIRLMEQHAARAASLEEDWGELNQMALNFKKQEELARWTQELRDKVYIHIVD